MKAKLKYINIKLELITTDSKDHQNTKSEYLPGGTIGIFTGKLARMIIKEHNTKDKFGRQTSTRIEAGKRKMQIFNVYRIPESTQSGILKSRAQYNRVGSKVKSSREYRTEMLRDLTNEINVLKNKEI